MPKDLPGRAGVIRRVAAGAAVAASALLIAGCAAGQDAQTVNQRPPIDGASADAGAISIRAAAVVADEQAGSSAKGGSALLRLVIINNGPQDEQLQSVASPVAGSAQLGTSGVSNASSSTGSEFPSASASDSGSASPTASGSASGSATASGSASGSPSATGTASGSASATDSSSATVSISATSSAASTPIPIPAGQTVQVGFDPAGPNISLNGLATELYPAQTVQVTFTFGSGASITLNIPVQLPSSAASAPVISDATEASEPNG